MATGSNCIGAETPRSQLRREDFMETAVSIEQDFRRLVQTLEGALARSEAIDEELLQQISSTKNVAERGLRLSRILTRLSRNKRA
jgi:hypothetical protein